MTSYGKKLPSNRTKIISKILNIDDLPVKSSIGSRSNSSEMDTRVIYNIQARINNPIFNLSIKDFEDMCGNKMIIRMMSKVLGCEVKRLNKFCKYINVFKDNINLSPKSIKNKMKSKMALSKLPPDILTTIVNKYKSIISSKYILRSWISETKLEPFYLSSNPTAIDYLQENPKKINWERLSENPAAIELLKDKINQEKKINYRTLKNIHPYNKVDWERLSRNPEAIELLENNINEIHWGNLSNNPNAIELLKKKIFNENEIPKYILDSWHTSQKINWKYLSGNPNAIELLKANPEKIDWDLLSSNPNAMELLKENPTKINWKRLSANPNAIELLKKNQDNIDWDELIANPNAIELIKANLDKIDLAGLSANPNTEAIELLEKYPEYIQYSGIELSGNPNPKAINLLRKNIYIIDWKILSINPSVEAINLLKDYRDKIDWHLLSANPVIFEEKQI